MAIPRKAPVTDQPAPEKRRAGQVIRALKKQYPDAECTLTFSTPLELLIATILAAQCTDERVNLVTADLFRRFRSCQDYLNASPAELQNDIMTTGFFRNKQKAIQGACQIIQDQFRGEVPQTMEELTTLPGVGRKTANVVLGNAFGITSGIVVDTHVTRLSHRLNFSTHDQAEKIEADLVKLVPRKDWVIFSHLLIAHGRTICKARLPLCSECVIERLCPSSMLKTGEVPRS